MVYNIVSSVTVFTLKTAATMTCGADKKIGYFLFTFRQMRMRYE